MLRAACHLCLLPWHIAATLQKPRGVICQDAAARLDCLDVAGDSVVRRMSCQRRTLIFPYAVSSTRIDSEKAGQEIDAEAR